MLNKKTKKWNDNIMIRFLELYQHHECLWNNNSGGYKNKSARNTAIQEIMIELNLNLTDADIRNKIKSIRTMYRRELLLMMKSKNSGAGPDDIYIPTLNWFNKADSFLRAVTIAKEISSSLDLVTETSEDAGSSIGTTSPILEQIDTNEFIQPSTSQTPASRVFESSFRKRKLNTINEAIDKLYKISSSEKQKLDEFDHFGKFVTVQLRKMPEYDAILCQEELHSIIRKYRLQALTIPLNNEPCMSPLQHSLPTTPSPTQIYIKNEM